MKPYDICMVGENNNEIWIHDPRYGLIPADPYRYSLQINVERIPYKRTNEQFKYNKRAESHEKFIFAKLEPETRFCPDLDFATLWRLAVLATYSSFSTDGTDAYLTNDLPTRAQRPMTKSEMQNILGLQKRTFNRFLNNICHVDSTGELKQDCFDTNGQVKTNFVNYLYPANDGKWFLNSDYFIKGTLVRGQQTYVNRIFVEAIRKLHKASKQSQHKQLGMILSLLPYLNKKWNVICSNPLEEDHKKIKPLSARDICKVLGLDIRNAEKTIGRVSNEKKLYGRLYQSLLDVELEIEGRLQLFCALRVTKYDCAIVVNPNFIFLGEEKEKWAIIESNGGFENPYRLTD